MSEQLNTLEVVNPPIALGTPQVKKICGAKTKKDGTPCQQTRLYPNGRCRVHGGPSLSGMANPAYSHGRNSKYMKVVPKELREGYRKSIDDEELVSLRHELGLQEAMIADALKKMGEIVMPDWGGVLKLLVLLKRDLKHKVDPKDVLEGLEELAREGYAAARKQVAMRREVQDLIQQKTKTAAAEWKRLTDMDAVLTVEQVMVFANALLSSVKDLTDQQTFRAINAKALAMLPVQP